MNDFQGIGSALYTALGGTASNAHYGVNVQGAAYPCIVFERSTGVDDYAFGTADYGIDTEYVIKAVSNRQWPSEAYSTYNAAHALVQNKALTVTGYTALRCQRRLTLEYRDPDGYWHVGGVYRVEVWKT